MTIEIEHIELKLGERDYRVPAAGLTRSELWRGRLQTEINALLAVLREQGGAFETIDLGNLREVSNLNLVELIPVIGSLFARLNVSLSALGEMIAAYHPDLEADRDYILENTTTRQAVGAVMEMIKLEYPFGMVFSQNGKPAGPPAAMTSPNSPIRPGGSRRKR